MKTGGWKSTRRRTVYGSRATRLPTCSESSFLPWSNIRSILKSGILCEERVYRRERNRDGGIVELYSLEMIAALAFRLKSGNAEAFRRWLVRRATTTAVVWQLPGMNTILN